MARETLVDSRQEILRTAARLFQQRGYDATSMNDVAAALKLSKGGLYHHFQSKDEILFEIMNHAMEMTQERVIAPVRSIADPVERLRALIRLHIEVVLSPRDREITVMLHENHPLPPALRKRINHRKKEYVHFVESLIADVQRSRARKGRGEPACRGLRPAGHDQLDLPVVQAGRRAAGEQSDSAIHRTPVRRNPRVDEVQVDRAMNVTSTHAKNPAHGLGYYRLREGRHGRKDRSRPDHRERLE